MKEEDHYLVGDSLPSSHLGRGARGVLVGRAAGGEAVLERGGRLGVAELDARATDAGAVDAVLVRVGRARVEARVVDASVGENPGDGVSGDARRVPGRGRRHSIGNCFFLLRITHQQPLKVNRLLVMQQFCWKKLTADLRCIQCHINYMTLKTPIISCQMCSIFQAQFSS